MELAKTLTHGEFAKRAAVAYRVVTQDDGKRRELDLEATRMNAQPLEGVDPQEIVRRGQVFRWFRWSERC